MDPPKAAICKWCRGVILLFEANGEWIHGSTLEPWCATDTANPCSCGKPFPFDGGAEGICECCSTCMTGHVATVRDYWITEQSL